MTISDIARLAGVSNAAVSRYLNGGPLSEQKREAIHAVVEQTGYRPDAAAQTLRTGKVRQVGVIVPSISSQSVGQITAGIAHELEARSYLVLLANTGLDEQRERSCLTVMQRNHVAGIILLGADYTPPAGPCVQGMPGAAGGHGAALPGGALRVQRGPCRRPGIDQPDAGTRPQKDRVHRRQ